MGVRVSRVSAFPFCLIRNQVDLGLKQWVSAFLVGVRISFLRVSPSAGFGRRRITINLNADFCLLTIFGGWRVPESHRVRRAL